MASPVPAASGAGGPPAPSRGWLARVAPLAGAFVCGLLYATLVLFCVYHAGRATFALPIAAYLLLPALALAVPSLLLALAALRADMRGGRVLWAVLLALTTGVAVGAPALLIVAPQALAAGEASAILLAAFTFGTVVGLLAARFAAPPSGRATWRTGLRAAAVGWLGVSVVLGVWLGFQFHDLVIPGPTTLNCHGLACGALLMVAVAIVIGGGVKTLVLGLPAALLAGCLACILGSPPRASAQRAEA
jgi:hypothetical protein